MHSYISNSDTERGKPTAPFAIVKMLLNCTWPAAVVFFVLVALCQALLVVGGAHPRVAPTPIENAIIMGQLARAENVERADLLIIGDSSALMGVDARRLGGLLGGKRVESLATIGYIGPRGYAKILSIYRQSHGGALPDIVLLINGQSLILNDRDFIEANYEKSFLDYQPGAPPPLLSGIRDNLFQNIVKRLINFPLPGSYGVYYGSEENLIAKLFSRNGTVEDPNFFRPPEKRNPFHFSITPAFEKRMPALHEEISLPATGKVFVGFTPLPEFFRHSETQSENEETAARVATLLGLPSRSILKLQASMRDELFATKNHLNKQGKELFTQMLWQSLRDSHKLR